MRKSDDSDKSVSQAGQNHEQEWERILALGSFPLRQVERHKSIIRWFLSFCRKQSPPLSPNRKSGNYFYATMVKEKEPKEWQKKQWKEAIGMYLDIVEPRPGASLASAPANEAHAAAMAEAGWESQFIRVLRCRHLSYRTEQTYLGWLKRFECTS